MVVSIVVAAVVVLVVILVVVLWGVPTRAQDLIL